MMRVLVADDEPLAREILCDLLAAQEGVEVVAEAATGLRAVELAREFTPDAAFLDIDMPEGDGIDAAARMRRNCACEVIIVTAHEEHAIDAFDVGVTDYILKPVRRMRLRLALDRVRARLEAREALRLAPALAAAEDTHVWVSTLQGNQRLDLAQVNWVEAARDHVFFHTEERAFMHRATMDVIEREFATEDLVRVHRSAFARLSRVKTVRRTGKSLVLELNCGTRVPVGPSYRDQVMAGLHRA